MKKGIHLQMQWIFYVTQSAWLINIMMTKIHDTGKVYHLRAKHQMAQSVDPISNFSRRYGLEQDEEAKPK
ncbi:50S ribosomal L31 [Carex littledalei]|uniref:50S ribosomal L31 n=1 Tax=Carex littledalei TaxID=544730 RepID=A0A833QW51_9POAL|nr:50S ribosomal L31 [Carex littledalei]